uniref:Uncharacterized protein n=1 Tax=Avena sativa TaxID=4498 RepID=A0ACD5ZU53_AVESA
MADAAPWFFLFFSLASLGAIHVSTAAFRLLAHLALCLRRPRDLRRRYGTWAVVTGPTSGIGRSMAMELAGRRGLNLVLVGRDPAKLREISTEICRTHAVQTKTVLFDFSLVSTAQGEKAMARLREAVEGLDVGVLVNNAGIAKPGAVYFHEVDVEAWARMIRVNVLALTDVTAAVVPGMAQRGRGAIVNIGSGSASLLPSYPLYSVYAGTKRYVAEFSRSLSVEYGSRGIDVQCQVPFLVQTNMVSSALKSTFLQQFVVPADAYAQAAVRWIGHGAVCVPSVPHRMQWFFAGCWPESVYDAARLEQHQKQRAIFRKIRPWRKTVGNSAKDGRVATDDKIGSGVRSE